MTDKSTKVLLLVIAVGLWANLAAQWFTPTPVQAQGSELRQIRNAVRDIERDLGRIQLGTCINSTIC